LERNIYCTNKTALRNVGGINKILCYWWWPFHLLRGCPDRYVRLALNKQMETNDPNIKLWCWSRV